MRTLSIAFLIFTALLVRAGNYSQSMFHTALTNTSTSPDYVLIQVRGQDDKTKDICTTANLFLGAIHSEYGLGYTEADEKLALAIALRSPERSFTFRKQAAIDNLVDYATPEALKDVRRLLASKKDSDLFDRELILSITNKSPEARHRAYTDAVARVLLERGIGCKMGCRSDQLFPH